MAKAIIAVLLFLLPLCAHAQILPDSPKPKLESPHKFNRKLFWTGTALLAASQAADAGSTVYLLNRGGFETNPLFGRHPSAPRLVGVNLAIFATQVGTFYLTEHSRNRWIRWAGRAYVGVVITNHVRLASCNPGVAGTTHVCFNLGI